jgi:hypothetical protein
MDAFEAVSSTETTTQTAKKYFSLAEANRSLTLVRRIVEDVIREYRQLCELHAACRSADVVGHPGRAKSNRQRYAAIVDHLAGLSEELEKIGCELKDYRLGLVDFPARLRGREICLCWKAGEDSVQYWHEIDHGYAGRRPVLDDFA